MLIKFFSLAFISMTLNGCFSSSPKPDVIIVEKSFNQQNRNLNLYNTKQSNPVPTLPKKKIQKKSWNIPVTGKVVKTFSKKHQGLTFNTKLGQTVRAIRDGTVVYSGDKMKSHGKMIIIKHPLGFYSSYTQNQSLKVKSGDEVKRGQVIALTGTDNFYFEMKKFETPINPLKYLK